MVLDTNHQMHNPKEHIYIIPLKDKKNAQSKISGKIRKQFPQLVKNILVVSFVSLLFLKFVGTSQKRINTGKYLYKMCCEFSFPKMHLKCFVMLPLQMSALTMCWIEFCAQIQFIQKKHNFYWKAQMLEPRGS